MQPMMIVYNVPNKSKSINWISRLVSGCNPKDLAHLNGRQVTNVSRWRLDAMVSEFGKRYSRVLFNSFFSTGTSVRDQIPRFEVKEALELLKQHADTPVKREAVDIAVQAYLG